jgi:hypothetical protein
MLLWRRDAGRARKQVPRRNTRRRDAHQTRPRRAESYQIDGRLPRAGAANFSASELKRQDNDLIVLDGAGAEAVFKRDFDARLAAGGERAERQFLGCLPLPAPAHKRGTQRSGLASSPIRPEFKVRGQW